MQVDGVTKNREYRVRITAEGRDLSGLIPEAMVASAIGWNTDRPPHGAVYDWIGRHAQKIEQVLIALHRGERAARPPFDQIALVEETDNAH